MKKKKPDPLTKLLREKCSNKKDVEEIKRLFAEIESEARSQSEKRQERIKVLWQEMRSGKPVPKNEEPEGTSKELKNEVEELFAEQAPVLAPGEKAGTPRPVRNETHKSQIKNELQRCLLELVILQKDEIEYLARFRRELERIRDYDPKQLEYLSTASGSAELLSFIEKQRADEEPKKAWERKRSRLHRDFRKSIEYQFGGGAEDEWNEWRKQMQHFPPALWPDHPIYKAPPPTCLDKIFARGSVNMRTLEDLFFGIDRHRLRKLLQGVKKRYDWEAVVQIMDSLLNEEMPEGEKPGRGSPRKVWLYDPKGPGLRTRVLSGIEARLNRLSVSGKIRRAFLKVIRRYLPDSGNK